MGSTNYLGKPKSGGYRVKSGSSIGSDKEMNGKLKRNKIRRPTKITEYGLKRIPDYTELAYKEAVGKLRYFLSGNYPPSVRSFGGGSASIKNLDESDGDLEKKYSPYSSGLSDLKSRPRLTTKYTTLYADSLNNYTPKHTPAVNVTSAPSPGSGGDAGGTNPDVINFIQKQEEYIEQLERESQYCRDELNNLLGKVKEVISENEHLHEAQKNKLITRMFHSYNAGSETDDLEDVGDSTGLDSDNKFSPSKSRKSTKYRASSKLEGPNIVFESRIAELEAQLTQSKIDLKKVQDENNENKRKLASGLVDSTCLDGFKRQIDNLQRDKSSLEGQISKLKLSLETRDTNDDGRYKRNDAVEQQLREERNNLEAELRRLKDELSKERSKVREMAGEGARRAVAERSAAEQRYHAHFDELQHDLAAQYDNVAKLQLDLERQRREENELKREISMKSSAIEELKMELKNKTSSLQADLAQAYAEKASLEEELANARLAIERHQRQSKHEANRLNSEIQSLRQRLDRADADLVHSRRENLRLTEQISTLEKELNMKNLTPITPEKKKKERELSTMLESMENKHAKTVAELETMIQSQNSLMEKLTGECRLLTDKLDDANLRHKTDRTQLLCRNSELMRKLRNLWCTHKKYCTTTVPFRSYTPISGYPHSRSSYDIDRTYYTSTPYTNRYRRPESRYGSVGDLTRNLSDLSIDRIDSDDDSKVIAASVHELLDFDVDRNVDSPTSGSDNGGNGQELATLQRQVNTLGLSLQSTPRTPPSSYYQASSPQPTNGHRDVPPATDPGRDDPRADPARDSPGHLPARAEPTRDTDPSVAYTKPSVAYTKPNVAYTKPSVAYTEPASAYSPADTTESSEDYKGVTEPTLPYNPSEAIQPTLPYNPIDQLPEPAAMIFKKETEANPIDIPTHEYDEGQSKIVEGDLGDTTVVDDAPQHYDDYDQSNYEQTGADYENYEQQPQNYEQHPQNYEQQPQNYEQQPQNYEQPQYTDGNYEGYDQYQQEYDPNAQYDDGTYQAGHDNSQYPVENVGYQGQYQEGVPEPTKQGGQNQS